VKRFDVTDGTGAYLIRRAHKKELTAAAVYKTPEELLDSEPEPPVEPPSPVPTPTPSPTPPTPNPDPETPPEPREPKPDTPEPSPDPILVPPPDTPLPGPEEPAAPLPTTSPIPLCPLRQKMRPARGYSVSRGNTHIS
jgi:hypothetical protein